MITKAFFKKSTLFIALIFSSSLIAADQPTSPFQKYDPNKVLKENQNNPQGAMLNGMLSPDQEIQIRDLIFQEFKMREEQVQQKKDSGLLPLDDEEILFLGPAESLRGTVKGQYLIYNTTTKMFRYVDKDKYKKVVSSEEIQQLKEKEQLKEDASGKVTK